MINILKALSGEINKDDYNYKQVFPKKNLFFHEYLTPHSYLDNNSHTSCLFEILIIYFQHKKYLNINNFVNRVAIAKMRLTSCKLAVVTGKWNKLPLEHRAC